MLDPERRQLPASWFRAAVSRSGPTRRHLVSAPADVGGSRLRLGGQSTRAVGNGRSTCSGVASRGQLPPRGHGTAVAVHPSVNLVAHPTTKLRGWRTEITGCG